MPLEFLSAPNLCLSHEISWGTSYELTEHPYLEERTVLLFHTPLAIGKKNKGHHFRWCLLQLRALILFTKTNYLRINLQKFPWQAEQLFSSFPLFGKGIIVMLLPPLSKMYFCLFSFAFIWILSYFVLLSFDLSTVPVYCEIHFYQNGLSTIQFRLEKKNNLYGNHGY